MLKLKVIQALPAAVLVTAEQAKTQQKNQITICEEKGLNTQPNSS
jgi:hypothetical protein